MYFLEALGQFRDDLGLDTHFVGLDSEASVEANAQALFDFIVRTHRFTGKKIILIGHSKGGLDAAAAVALYPELQRIVGGLVFVQSPYGGSPIAADMLVDEVIKGPVEVLLTTVMGTRVDALHDLTYEGRQQFVQANPLPGFKILPTVSFHSTTESRLSPFFLTGRYIKKRYGEPSDGVVACRDAEVPGSVVVRYNSSDVDHLGCVYPTPNVGYGKVVSGADICEALVRLLLHHAGSEETLSKLSIRKEEKVRVPPRPAWSRAIGRS